MWWIFCPFIVLFEPEVNLQDEQLVGKAQMLETLNARGLSIEPRPALKMPMVFPACGSRAGFESCSYVGMRCCAAAG